MPPQDHRRFTKPMLVALLEKFPTVRPPRVHQQAKAELVACVGRALAAAEPLRSAMRQAIDETHDPRG